jgi:hypothetical protein
MERRMKVHKKVVTKESPAMKNMIGMFLLLICLSGCMVTASSGTRTEYDDKMKVIEKDYKEMKITKDEYDQLKSRASQQGNAVQKNSPTSSGQSYP